MRHKRTLICLSTLLTTSTLLHSYESHTEDPHYEWFEEEEVAVLEDGVYTDSNKGMIKLNVVEHDRVNNRYKVQCNCLKIRDRDQTDGLSMPPDKENNY